MSTVGPLRLPPVLPDPSRECHVDVAWEARLTLVTDAAINTDSVTRRWLLLFRQRANVYVIKDCCADLDQELHTCLVDKLFVRQATVITAAEFTNVP